MSETRPCSKCGLQHARRSRTRWYSYCHTCHRDHMRELRARPARNDVDQNHDSVVQRKNPGQLPSKAQGTDNSEKKGGIADA